MNTFSAGMKRSHILGLAALACALVPSAQAAIRMWGNTGTDFNAAASWTNAYGPPLAADSAYFTNAVVAQPNLSAPIAISQLRFFANAFGYDLTSTGGATLSLNSATLSPTAASSACIYTQNASGTNTIDAPIVLNAGAGKINQFNPASGGLLVVNGTLSEGNPGTVLSLGTGQIKLTGNNAYSGETFLIGSACSVTITNFNALGTGSMLGLGTGKLNYQGAGETPVKAIDLYGATGTAGTIDTTGAGGALILTNDLQVSGAGTHTLAFTGDSIGNEFRGKIIDGGSGATSVTKSGAGAWTIAGANTFTGATTINLGLLNLNSNNALGIGGQVEIHVASTIDNTSANPVTLGNNPFLLTDDLTYAGTRDLKLGTGTVSFATGRTITANGAGILTIGGNFTNTATTALRTMIVNGPGRVVFNGRITTGAGTSTTALTINNATLVVTLGGDSSGAGGYTGATTLSAGTINVNNNGAFGNNSVVGVHDRFLTRMQV